MTKFSITDSIMIAYFCIMIFTFGHSFNQVPDTEKGEFAGQSYTIRNGGGTKTIIAAGSSLFWPLYWSVKLQEK